MITVKKELDDIDKQIIKLAGEGKTSKEIGSELNKSSYVISNRLKEMFRYFKCKNRAELVKKFSNL